MAAGGGPCIPLASRILKDRSKPWQGTARARIPTCFMAESRIFRNLLSAMKHVGISSWGKIFLLFIVFPSCTVSVRISVRPIIGRLLYNANLFFAPILL